MATTPPPAAGTTLRDSRQPTPTSPVAPTPTTAVPVLLTSASESSDDGIRLSPAAARRFARRNLRRTSPTPDLVTSLVRPPSPDTFYVGAQVSQQVRQDVRARIDPSYSGLLIPNVNSDRRTGPLLPPHPSSLGIPKRYGGNCIFDMYSLTYVNEPDANLLCPICHDPLVDPVTTPCDHTFCYRCLRQSIDSSPSGTACPIDREPLAWPNCFSAPRLIRTQLNSLKVKCPYHARGCKSEVRREVVETHASTECRFKDFTCPGADCDKRLRSKPEDDTCPHKEDKCLHCKVTIEATDRELHLLSCPNSKTRCETCWKLVYRSQTKEHDELECEGAVINCPYSELGCPARAMRGQMDAHTLACAFHPDTPSGMIIRSQREIIDSYTNLGQQVQQLQTRQDETNQRITEFNSSLSRRGVGDSVMGDNRTIQDLDAGFEEVHQNLTHLEARQSMWTINQIMPIREEVTELRNNINMIRMHVNWLLNRSREEGRIRAAASSGSTATLQRDRSVEGPRLAERRRSASVEGTDLPRL
ncbi:hypothetical protein FOQG_04900 [Fusarium oxysporum f. sp. raphani 54005]|uniref:TNF receptor-associated factor 6 n=2 Tax=Fusarium oxysporum f. sp. raphani TaxID=96318 RepID=X0DGQ3_FUSOX|nr:hypothetical protein FOQG_04900 [Fusarium oxysporum f. sp. raphani 54005]KAG7438732.1 TNF receptor-associated factor 6 [Fusarium oxysporum f. sp. raphani]